MGRGEVDTTTGVDQDDAVDVVDVVDGRRARGERNREAVAEALLDLLQEGDPMPSAAAIADRAGVSLRSVFRYFDDLESLYAAAVERHLVRLAALYEIPPTSRDLDERVDALVRSRARLWEAVTPVRRVAERVKDSSASIQSGLERARRFTRRQVGELFATELDGLGAADRRLVVDALEMATSWATWNQLRAEQGCSTSRAQAIVSRTVLALLTP